MNESFTGETEREPEKEGVMRKANVVNVLLLTAGMLASGSSLLISRQAMANENVEKAILADKDKDKQFITQAARGGKAEVELSQLAAERGTDKDVVQLGQKMIQDHGLIGDELKRLAERKGIALPKDELDAKGQATKDRLVQTAERSGIAFDREYVRKMVADHEMTVAMFEREARNTRDPEIRDWALRTLPTLRDHLQHVHDLDDDLRKRQTAKR